MAKKPNTARNQMALKVMHDKIHQAIGRLETGNTGTRPILFQNKDVVVYAVAEHIDLCEFCGKTGKKIEIDIPTQPEGGGFGASFKGEKDTAIYCDSCSEDELFSCVKCGMTARRYDFLIYEPEHKCKENHTAARVDGGTSQDMIQKAG